MKKIICLIFFLVAQAVLADVVSARYDDEGVHFGLPGWVSMLPSDPNVLHKEVSTFEQDETSTDFWSVVQLPEYFAIEYAGRKYAYLTVNQRGYIEFGVRNDKYEKLPKITLDPRARINLGQTFEWGVYSQVFDDRTDDFVIINFGPFVEAGNHYSIQVLIYRDGEVQVQYWKHDEPSSSFEDWMVVHYDDGISPRVRAVDAYASSFVDIYGSEGLRPGWIAKTINPKYEVDITEPQKGTGLFVQMKSDSLSLGGIIAYDYSREHPVVGSIASIDVVTSGFNPIENVSRLYCWYFNEYYPTNQAGYPYFSNETPSLQLSKQDYNFTWNAYKTNPNRKENFITRTDEEIDFIGAPAFKFQRTRRSNTGIHDFYINSIRYNLAQPMSVQFLPRKTKQKLFVQNSQGGVIDLFGLTGVSSPNSSYNKTYELYVGQPIEGTIIASSGYFIDKVTIVRFINGHERVEIYKDDELLVSNDVGLSFSVRQERRELQIKGNMPNGFVSLIVTYKKCVDRGLPLIVPFMVKTESHTAPQSAAEDRITASALIYDAFGGVAQTQKKVIDGKYSVSSTYTNDMNQVTKTPMPFVHNSSNGDFEYVDMACGNCITEANAYYYRRSSGGGTLDPDDDIDRPDAEDYAFTEVKYYNANENENGSKLAFGGIAKRAIDFKNGVSAQTWEMPAYNEDDFVKHEHLDNNILKQVYKDRQHPYYFVLRIHRDGEGKYTQEIFNSKGQLKSSWKYDGTNEIVVKYEYDAYGHLLKSYEKGHPALAYETAYDEQGRVSSTTDTDRGTTMMVYDSFGRLSHVRSARHCSDCFMAYFYDGLGRPEAVGEVSSAPADLFEDGDADILTSGANVRYTSKTIYGKPEKTDLTSLGVDAAIAQSILNEMDNVRPNDVGAVVSFDDNGSMVKVSLSKYDRIGQKTRQWAVYGIARAPALQLSYSYNQSGELVSSSFGEWDGSQWVEKSVRTRVYDWKGRLEKTREDGNDLATYEYTENDNLKKSTYYDAGVPVMTKTIMRDVYGRPTELRYEDGSGKLLYSEAVSFDTDESARVGAAEHEWGTANENISKENSYAYDDAGRLVSVSGDQTASYEYDILGRMKKKVEGDSLVDYIYFAQKFRPTSMNVNGRNPAGAEYLLYDDAGNVWLDARNKVAYKHGDLGLPTHVYSYKTTNLPQNVTLDDVNEGTSVMDGADMQIDYAYDGGQRVWTHMYGAGINAEELTVPGIGRYIAYHISSNGEFTLNRMDLVAGGYRDMGSNKAYFPVTDVQGNIRGYATTDGLETAYDYYAYGTQIELVSTNGADMRRWQGKEFDGQHGKYYFGARYFDPFFALWMSPDPAGQFSNPYTYGGDPVNYVDPNGEWVHIVIGAAIGAVMGVASALSQCTGKNGGSCATAIPVGYEVGAASGAAAAATGGAIGGMAAAAGEGAIAAGVGAGALAGAAGSGAGYTMNYAMTGQGSLEGGIRAVATGAVSGAVGGAVSGGLSYAPFAGSPIIDQSVSNVASSMVAAGMNGEDISDAAVSGLYHGALSSLLYTPLSLAMVYAIGDPKALNRAFKLGEGEWMTEGDATDIDLSAYKSMPNNPGSVSASVVSDWQGFLIALISGGGPFSHVRGSDKNGQIIENNNKGVMEYRDPEYKSRDPSRLTYVTRRYVGGQNYGVTVSSLRGNSYWSPKNFLCVGATSRVNPYYVPSAPNAFVPWGMRNASNFYY